MNWVVIPAYNESSRVIDVINDTKKYCKNIIVVDDGSIDNTYSIALKTNVKVLRHKINLGKGAALKTGCDYALMQGAKNIIVMDADGQHKPHDIPAFIDKIKDKDILFGFRKGQSKMPFVLKFGNNFLSTIIQVLFNIRVKDSQNGFRAFTANAYKKVRWQANDYFMETEMIIRAGKFKLKYAQIPIETIYNDRYKGTTVFDGVKIFTKIIAQRLTP